jgi:hypothetical protein
MTIGKALRLSQLSPARQGLVRLCQTINHGSIEDLEIRHSEPVLEPLPVMLKDVKLDADEQPRPEFALVDFVLADQVCRLLSLLDKMESGTIRHIEVRAGIPRRVRVESQGFRAGDLWRQGKPSV